MVDTSARNTSSALIFSTPWFNVVAKTLEDQQEPYYSLELPDYVSVIAITDKNHVLLVRQYRPAVDSYTLELPAGHVDAGETPAESAERELLEETGYQANHLELLGCLLPDTGRLSNRSWCFFSDKVFPSKSAPPAEPGVELVTLTQADLRTYILDSRFSHSIHLASILLAVQRRRLELMS